MTAKRTNAKAVLNAALVLTTYFNFAPSPAQGQTTKKLLKRYETEKHIGTIDEALVGITVEYHDAAGKLIDVRHGNGVVVRCDGFILVPEGLYHNRPGLKIDAQSSTYLHLYPGTAKEEKVLVKPPLEYNLNGNIYLLRSKTIHVPAVRCLLPEGIKKGADLESVSADWDAAAKRFLKPVHHAVHRGDPSLDSVKLMTSKLDETLESAMTGSPIVTSEGMLFGMTSGYDGSYQRNEFFNMSLLDGVTSSVGAVPTTDADFLSDHPKIKPVAKDDNDAQSGANKTLIAEDPEGSSNGMASVLGGPVDVPITMQSGQPDFFGVTVACVNAFQIDKYEVSNEDYYKFWKELAIQEQKDYFPTGWRYPGVAFTSEYAKLPVIGVPYKGAALYAKKQGKRLPSANEWIKAALGPPGENVAPAWLKSYVADRNGAAARIEEQHENFLLQNPMAHYSFLSMRVKETGLRNQIEIVGAVDLDPFWPWKPSYMTWIYASIKEKKAIDNRLETTNIGAKVQQMIEFSHDLITAEADGLDNRWNFPLVLNQGGAKQYDVSSYGVSDMLMSCDEYVLTTNPQRGGVPNAMGMRWQQDYYSARGVKTPPWAYWMI